MLKVILTPQARRASVANRFEALPHPTFRISETTNGAAFSLALFWPPMAELLRIDQVIDTAIEHELAKAKLKFGACRPDLIALQGNCGDTIDNRRLLRTLRFLNRTGSRVNQMHKQGNRPVRAAIRLL